MLFRTPIQIKPQQTNFIDYQSKVLLLGSCFADHIGAQLTYYKFQTLINPFGTLFHPLAIERVVKDSIEETQYHSNELIDHQSVYHSWFHHSKLSAITPDQVLQNVSEAQNQTSNFLYSASHVVITLGTSWVYELVDSKVVVANCHKMPSSNFTKRLLSIQEIVTSLKNIVNSILSVNQKCQIIFTVSPVRHTKDGLPENALSKAHLLSAIYELTTASDQVFYFPSYEIMMDDLRDYRFYEADMIHPNQQAINYIWEQFKNVWVTEQAQSYFKSIHSIQQGLLHRPLNENSEAHQLFKEQLAQKIQLLSNQLSIQF